MERRAFLWTTSLSSISILISLNSCTNKKNDLKKILSFPITLSYFLDKETIIKIGESFIKYSQINENHLSELLLKDIDKKNHSNSESIINNLQQKIKNDFEFQRIIELEGWIISQTEAEQCALFYFINT